MPNIGVDEQSSVPKVTVDSLHATPKLGVDDPHALGLCKIIFSIFLDFTPNLNVKL